MLIVIKLGVVQHDKIVPYPAEITATPLAPEMQIPESALETKGTVISDVPEREGSLKPGMHSRFHSAGPNFLGVYISVCSHYSNLGNYDYVRGTLPPKSLGYASIL